MPSPYRTGAGATAAAALLAAALLGLAATPAAAQDWRTVTAMRRASGEDAMHVELEYGAGQLKVRPGAADLLYKAQLRYDASVFSPVTRYDAGTLRIGLDGGRKGIKVKNHESGRLDLELGSGTPLDLDLKFGAVEADLELGGLRIRRAQVSTGASETSMRFSRPNPVRMESLELKIGAASFVARDLANANAARLDVQGGVSDVTLDFGGDWREDLQANVQMGVGSITLRIPRGIGVRVNKSGFLASFDSEGFTKRGGTYYSSDWADADHHLELDIDSAFGAVNIVWTS